MDAGIPRRRAEDTDVAELLAISCGLSDRKQLKEQKAEQGAARCALALPRTEILVRGLLSSPRTAD